ncbi:MAG TPA: protein kinase [Polyangiaceae bacterium]|nr:protein kinase [Polyangiaceae bacterium]
MENEWQQNSGGKPDEWTDAQWERVCRTVREEARRVRVGASFLPLYGPLPPEDYAPVESRSPRSAWEDPPESGGKVDIGNAARFVERALLGVGGMNRVVRAFDRDLRRDVAIKVLLPGSSSIGDEVDRFTTEARITGQLEHPYVIPVYEFGRDDRRGRFLAMRLVQGRTLEETLEQAGIARLETDRLADLLQVFLKVCEAMAFAHSKGIIHRDLKPSNVMISDFGQVYVLDWGIARRVLPAPDSMGNRPSEDDMEMEPETDPDPPGLVGTPAYMAPEQLWGLHDELGERADVFALGAILYQILTGRPPRLPESVRLLLMGQSPSDIPRPEEIVRGAAVPAELSRIALKAMSHDPKDRHASVTELRAEVDRFLRGSWHLPRVRFPAGTIIMTEGEAGESAYIIVEGRCVAFKQDGGTEIALREMGPGEVFGETAVLSQKPRSASVRAATDVLAMVVTGEILSNALGLNDWMGTFVRALANRFRDVDERLRLLEQEERRRTAPPR